MNDIPVFVFHELLIGLEELDANVGDYISHYLRGNETSVFTTTGKFRFSDELVHKQFKDPRLVLRAELLDALSTFVPLNRTSSDSE